MSPIVVLRQHGRDTRNFRSRPRLAISLLALLDCALNFSSHPPYLLFFGQWRWRSVYALVRRLPIFGRGFLHLLSNRRNDRDQDNQKDNPAHERGELFLS